jgi:hypothetical protein
LGTSIAIEEIIGIDHAVDVLSRDGSIEQQQLEELLTIQSFRVRATYPNDAQCIAGISPDAEGMASFVQRGDYNSSPARCAFKKASAPWQNERALILRFGMLVSNRCCFKKREASDAKSQR